MACFYHIYYVHVCSQDADCVVQFSAEYDADGDRRRARRVFGCCVRHGVGKARSAIRPYRYRGRSGGITGRPTESTGAVGFGVRLFDELVRHGESVKEH
jgi:hypothetical protein